MSAFENDVVELVHNMLHVFNRKREHKCISNRICRGRAPSSGPEFEEELAKLVEKHTPDDVNLLIDFPLSFRPYSAAKTRRIYPDIAVVRQSCLIGILEAKIDLGYVPSDWLKTQKQKLDELALVGKVTTKGQEYDVLRQLKIANVVLSAHNHTEQLLEGSDSVFVLLSTKHSHPNDGRIKIDLYIDQLRTDNDYNQWGKLEHFIAELCP